MNARITTIASIMLLTPLPVSAQSAVYVRPAVAVVLAVVFGIAAAISGVKAVQQWRTYRSRTSDDIDPLQSASASGAWAWTTASAVLIVAAVIASWWRVSRPVSPAPGDLERTQTIGAVKVLTIDRHWPERDATGVPSNSSIFLWFEYPMDRRTMIDDQGTADPSDDIASDLFVRIRQGGSAANPGSLVSARARSNADGTIVALDPVKDLSAGGRQTTIIVELKGLRTADGRPLFGSEGVYRWSFTAGANPQRNPPLVGQTFPRAGSNDVPANAGIQLSWSTAVDPLSFESGLEVRAGDRLVEGRWHVAEGERLTEFFPSQRCGQNQCRRDIGCFPFGGRISVGARSVDANAYPRQGVRDFQGNLLAPGQRALLAYQIGQYLNQSVPRIVEVQPSPDSSGIDPKTPVSARFSAILRAGSVDRRSVRLGGDGAWRVRVETDFNARASSVIMSHQPFEGSSVLQGLISSDVEDIYQNCFAQCQGP